MFPTRQFAPLLLSALLLNFGVHRVGWGQNPFAEGVRKTEPLTANEELKSFTVPEGFKVEQVAAEPDILKPLNLNFDHRGRLWVTDSTEYPYPAPLDSQGRDTVKILEDTDGDGRYDQVKVFAEGLNIPIGLYPVPNGCIVFSIPNIWFLEDTDGDDRADRKTRLYGPMGYERDTHGMNNAFTRGFDGWLYACHGFNNETRVAGRDGHEIHMQSGNTYRMRLDGRRVEQFTWGQVNPFGMTIDELGNLFTADCHSKPVYQLIRGGYYPSFGKPHDGLGFVPPIMEHLHGSTAIAGVAVYADNRFPAAYQGNLFSGNVMTSRVNRNRLAKHGSTHQAIELPDFIQTTDPWYRPVDIQMGPDGALYIADFYNRIIGHYEVPLEHPGRDRFRGRIWRVSYVGTAETPAARPSSFESLDGKNDAELIAALADANLTARLLALNYLVDRSEADPEHHHPKSICQVAWSALQQSNNHHQRSALLWALARLGHDIEQVATRGLADPEIEVRTHTLRILSEQSTLSPTLLALTLKGLSDPAPEVRLAAADTLAQHPEEDQIQPLLVALGQVDEADILLRQEIRIALKQQLSSQADWFPEKVADLETTDQLALAAIALAVPTSESASFVLAQIQHDTSLDAAALSAQVRHVALHAEPEQLTVLAEMIPQRFGEQLAFQVEMLAAVEKGLRERGEDPRAILSSWGAELSERLLQRANQDQGWRNQPIAGRSRQDNPWVVQTRTSQDGVTSTFLCTLPAGEQATGELRSVAFTAPSSLQFYLAGHDGFPDQPLQNQNLVRLVDAKTGEVLRQTNPPRNDTAQRISWSLEDLEGREVQLSIVDGDEATAYAWLAIGRFDPAVIEVPEIGPRDRGQGIQQAALIVQGLGIDSLQPALLQTLQHPATDAPTRVAVATAALTQRPEVHLQALLPVLTSQDLAPEWLERFSKQLRQRDKVICRALLDEQLPSLAASTQTQVARQLAGSREGATLLLELVDQGKISNRVIANEQIAQSLLANLDAEGQQAVEGIAQQVHSSEGLEKRMADRQHWLTSQKGEFASGAEAFKKHCSACHQIAGQGAIVGPQLDGIGNRGLERLLEDLLDPNRNVDVAFRTTLIQTEDGGTLSGLLRKETEASLLIIDQQGKEILVDKDLVEIRQPSRLSLMPETLVADLPKDEFVNLIEFLLSQTTPATSE